MELIIKSTTVKQFVPDNFYGKSNVIEFIHWDASENGVTISGSTKLKPPMGTFTKYEDVTDDQLEAWVLSVDAKKISNNLKNTYDAITTAAGGEDETEANRVIRQTFQYQQAVKRLAQYVVADGRPEIKEMQDTLEQQMDDEGMPLFTDEGEPIMVQEEVVTQTAIDPVEATVEATEYDEEGNSTTSTIENPLITQDNAERLEAQEIIDNTPEEIKQ